MLSGHIGRAWPWPATSHLSDQPASGNAYAAGWNGPATRAAPSGKAPCSNLLLLGLIVGRCVWLMYFEHFAANLWQIHRFRDGGFYHLAWYWLLLWLGWALARLAHFTCAYH